MDFHWAIWIAEIPPGLFMMVKRFAHAAVVAVLLVTSRETSASFLNSPIGKAGESCASSWQSPVRSAVASAKSVAWGNGTYVAVGWHSAIFTSRDGAAWTSRSASADGYFESVAFGGGQFVVVGMNGTILTSPDGTTWTAREAGFQPFAYASVTWGGGRFVAVGSEGFFTTRWTVATSVDGVKWLHVSGSGGSLEGVAWGNGQFVAVGKDAAGAAILTSGDGTNWVRRSTPPVEYLMGVAYGSGQFVALNLYGPALTSPDGVSWFNLESDLPRPLGNYYGIAFGGGQFLALGNGPILTSPDGKSWAIRSWDGNDIPLAAAYGDGQFIVVGGGTVLSSPDAVFWWNRAWWHATLYGAAFGAGQFTAVGRYGTVLTSPDGTAWTQRFSGMSNTLVGLVYGGGQFVAVGAAGTILTSPDGVDWTPRPSGIMSDLSGVAWGEGRYVTVGNSYTTLTSPDGVTWTKWPGGAVSNAIVHGRDRFVAVGPYGSIRMSPDGQDWIDQPSGTGSHLFAVSYGAGQYVAVGASGTILTSPDGSAWTARNSGTEVDITAVGFGAGRFVAAATGFLRTSADGAAWTDPGEAPVNLPGYALAWGAGHFLIVGGGISTSACAATFSSLTVSRTGVGSGRVTSGPVGIDCGSACAASFETGTEVTLLAAPDAGSVFAEWEGDCTGAAACRIVMAGNRSATARFELVPLASVSRLVPIVLDVTSNAHYVTELSLTNGGANAVPLTIQYTPSLGSREGSGTVTDLLAPGEQRRVGDVLSYLRGKGLGIPSSSLDPVQGGTLLVKFHGIDSSEASRVAATARTAALTAAPQPIGRAGLAYSGLLVAEASTSSVTIYGLRSTPTDRTNVAVFNTSSDPVTLKVTVHSGALDGKSVVFRSAETLPAYGWLQYGSREILDGAEITKGWVTIERTSSTGSFSAYAVINDNATNDGSFVLPVGGSVAGSTLTVPVLVETPIFRSEFILANKSSSTVTLSLSYVESISPSSGAGGTMTVTLAPQEEQIIPEAIDFLRRNGVSIGAKDAASYGGALRVTVSGTTADNVFAGVRTASQSPAPAAGQFGLFTPCIYAGQEATAEAYLYGLRADAENRTNVAVVNTGNDSAGPILLHLQAYDGDAGGLPRGDTVSVSLSPGQWAQPTNFFKNSGVSNGWVKVTRMSGTAPWLAYGVVNDGGNPGERTGDGAYVPMTK